MYSVMWSEHCSYKSSKVHLAYFGETTTDEMRSRMLAGIGENAGVVDIGDGWAVTFKVESHNHPSYVEPYQGAATGVGGIVRDILAMGARPVAVMDQLRFGPADAPDSQRVVPGIVSGVGGYGNSLGLPNIGGEVVFDESYAGNPLVNAGCIGVLRAADMYTAHATGAGNKVILYGSRTGLDGIGGVSVLASDTFSGDGSAGAGSNARRKLPSVQVGDPFAEKVLIECTLEVFAKDLVVGIQDLGGAGLSCATSELASAGDGGMHIVLDAGAAARRAHELGRDPVVASRRSGCARSSRRTRSTRSSRSAANGRCRPTSSARSPTPVAWSSPTTARWWSTSRRARSPTRARSTTGRSSGRRRRMRCRPTPPPTCPGRQSTSSAIWCCRMVGFAEPLQPRLGHRPVRPLRARQHRAGPAGRRGDRPGVGRLQSRPGHVHRLQRPVHHARPVRRRPAGAGRGLPQRGHHRRHADRRDRLPELRLARGPGRDVAVVAGHPRHRRRLRGTRDPGHRRQCQPLQPDRRRRAILPTPVIGVLGVIDDVRRRIIPGIGHDDGETLILLGETRDELDGSEWANLIHGHLGGLPPKVDLEAERLLGEILLAGSRDGMVSAAHDLSEGGLAQAAVEMCLTGETGARLVLPPDIDPFVALFSESSARVLVAVPRTEELRFTEMCTMRQPAVGEGRRRRRRQPRRAVPGHPGRREDSARRICERPGRARFRRSSGRRSSVRRRCNRCTDDRDRDRGVRRLDRRGAGQPRRVEPIESSCARLWKSAESPRRRACSNRSSIVIPTHVLIRPRGGDFRYDKYEIRVMAKDIEHAIDRGAEAVVDRCADRRRRRRPPGHGAAARRGRGCAGDVPSGLRFRARSAGRAGRPDGAGRRTSAHLGRARHRRGRSSGHR